ncbi:RNA polymerase Rpb7-like domain-containing protein [Seiridium cupressi]
MSSEKKDKKSKRDKSEHKSKKRHRELEGQAEEERRHKRSRSEAPINDADGLSTEAQDVVAEQLAPADTAGQSGKTRRNEKRKEKRRHSHGDGAEETNTDVPMVDAAAANGVADEVVLEVANGEVEPETKKKKKDRKKHQNQEPEESQEPAQDIETAEAAAEVPLAGEDEEKKRRKKEKKEKRRKEKGAATANDADSTVVGSTQAAQPAEEPDDAMDLDNTPAKPSNQPFGKLPNKPYPFFTQQVSQYLPLYPLGMIDPIEGYAEQHLMPLLNHYVPTFEGVLLGYHDIQVGEAPGRGSLTEKSDTSDEALLESIDEYAVGFGWLTAKLDLFKPSRGAWMEGFVNMQTEGHLGVVCWGMFNASIEARRLPKGWRWVSLLGKPHSKGMGREKTPEEAKLPTPDPAEDGLDDVTQLHTTGYWVDDQNQRVRGSLRFQIKNFEVGVSGDYGYLSIEGTMLDVEAEKKRSADEVERLRRWKLKNGASQKEQKRLPDFSMTKFGMDEEQEDETQRAEVWKGSRPASEIAE